MEHRDFCHILSKMGLEMPPDSIQPFHNDEDGAAYRVWKVVYGDSTYVLKEAKGHEIETYQTFFDDRDPYAPALIGTWVGEDASYLLMEYVPGENLRSCRRETLIPVLDALIAMQKKWWQVPDPGVGFGYEASLSGRKNRLQYLKDPQLESAYALFLEAYRRVPRTLCHDDLLPFNVVLDENRAVFIDWECGGILPYPVSLVRFLAHCQENEDAFFYMTDADKAFAVDYYYENLIQEKGIDYSEYLTTIRLFWFYEFCEWVYVGNKYEDTSSDRFREYLQKAKMLATELV